MKSLILIFTLLFSFSGFSKALFNKASNTTLNIQNPSFVMACSMGLVEGCYVETKFGINSSLTLNVTKDIWDFGSNTAGNVDYTYPADGTAPIDTASSSNALDLQAIEITGLEINGDRVIQNVTLNGQNKVTLATSLWRSYRVRNIDTTTGADRTDGFAGNVYVYEDTAIVTGVPTDSSKVRAYVENGNNQTQMTHFTVSSGHTAFMLGGSAKMARKVAAAIVFKMWHRSFGSVFRLTDNFAIVSTGTGAYNEARNVPGKMSEKMDMVVSAESDTNNVGIAVSYDMIILKNSVFGI